MPADLGVRPATTSMARRTPILVGRGVLALALMLVATLMLSETTAVVRVPLFIAGLVIAYTTTELVLERWRGEPVDLAKWLASVWLGLVVAGALLVGGLPVAESRDVSKALSEPTLQRPDLFSRHPFGTDRQGLDILGQLMYGARVSLQVGIGGVALGLLIGGSMGIVAAYFGGKWRAAVAVLTDTVMGFPPIILLLGLVTILQPTVTNLTIGVAILGVPAYTRLAQAHTLTQRKREYVTAATTLGSGHTNILLREIVPNVSRPLMAYGFIMLGTLIVAEASLSFLGLGVQRPEPTWGNMIAAAQDDFRTVPHLVFVPGVTIFATVFALNLLGERRSASAVRR